MFDWISGFIDTVGLFGIALLMFVENVFPPIPSELIMPLGSRLINLEPEQDGCCQSDGR
jgi:membrane protein DedA with SNARE-associated domain